MAHKSIHVRAYLALSLLLACGPASAYIDPNAGGLLYQLLTPLVVMVIAFWRSLTAYVRRVFHSIVSRIRNQR